MMNESEESLGESFKMDDHSDALLQGKNDDSIDVMFCAPLVHLKPIMLPYSRELVFE